ncbi:hypothetical protein DPEC_G00188700 [Dallia pectoralis]|uniref:Uncharacterized protein n=1 Tax=Dallia pectoralis TaxID=75939 RepID=A0ACC2GC71_DALPE|nr:hypothetical protein DPEC_G00188700 [Dallia pectoralis]
MSPVLGQQQDNAHKDKTIAGDDHRKWPDWFFPSFEVQAFTSLNQTFPDLPVISRSAICLMLPWSFHIHPTVMSLALSLCLLFPVFCSQAGLGLLAVRPRGRGIQYLVDRGAAGRRSDLGSSLVPSLSSICHIPVSQAGTRDSKLSQLHCNNCKTLAKKSGLWRKNRVSAGH